MKKFNQFMKSLSSSQQFEFAGIIGIVGVIILLTIITIVVSDNNLITYLIPKSFFNHV